VTAVSHRSAGPVRDTLAYPIPLKSLGGIPTSGLQSHTIREKLRRSTASAHQAMHEHLGFVGLMEERISLVEYKALLARLYGFHCSLERGLRAAPFQILDIFNLRQRERSLALRADLRFLGMTEAEIHSLPQCEFLPAVSSKSDLLGRLYVVEGAGLGGRVLASKLNGLLGDHGSKGRSFFAARPAQDPLPWPAFCEWMEVQSRAIDISIAISSAEMTFRALAYWLDDGAFDV